MAFPIFAAISAFSTVAGLGMQAKAASEQRRANRLMQRQADLRAARERREQVRQNRIARARVLNASAASGTQGASSEFASVSGINSQLGQNLSESYITQYLSGQTTSALNRSASLERNANVAFTGANFISNNSHLFTPKKTT